MYQMQRLALKLRLQETFEKHWGKWTTHIKTERREIDKCMHINIPITRVTTVKEYHFKLHESMAMDMRVFVFVCMSTNVF